MPIAHTYMEPTHPLTQRVEREKLPGLLARIRVRWNSLTLDSALAGGANPDASEELALRARQLAEPKAREQVARSIAHLLDLVDRGSAAQFASIRVPFSRPRVQAIRPRLVELAESLRDDRAYPVAGLARANLLVEDGRGPLYVHDTPDGFEQAVEATFSALDS